ncbi:MAG: hypothetical protein HOP28_14125 [Gemmatimonadales bacterium]|nr:hypothetical protein [Gemmatimonadales bacterium]
MSGTTWQRAVAGIAAAGLLACGGEKITEADDFLPTLSNQWKDVADDLHFLQLNSTDDNEPAGAFEGTESRSGINDAPLAGTFTNSTLSMTITRQGGAVTFAGKFTHQDTLRLTRQGESFTVARQF